MLFPTEKTSIFVIKAGIKTRKTNSSTGVVLMHLAVDVFEIRETQGAEKWEKGGGGKWIGRN